ncbi:energy transducer TonB [Pseudoblastomonas halimionae]|uniref:Energy transducer TonB n=1 Tax=Alteriqipengyuania halimionae TaxID=1926630 RepID=A0A6I4U284_9SPHN|nr:energy transducer TonB [Alteriqipengyuania halimionae]MXP08611.1 energy transducer TonB [Alteriqipengyuania halimionae]
MATRSLATEEKYALPLAVVLHLALVAVLLWKPVGDAIVQPPERITVSLTDDVGLTSTAPMPVPDAAPPAGGKLVEDTPDEVAPETPSEPIAQPRSQPRADPVVRPKTRSEPRATPKRTETPRKERSSPPKRAESRGEIGKDFLGGGGATKDSSNSGTPAAEIGPRVRNSLAGSISRQLKPHWSAPQGADADQLVTILAWDLNRDGSLSGTPRVVRQLGITDSNRAQAGRHAEQAIRAVRLAAPFNLPEEYYDAWKRVSDFRFDRRL